MANQTPHAKPDDKRTGGDRRNLGDRRKANLGPPPPGIERRNGDRRSGRDRRRPG